jgi:hypothetical protein
MLNSPFHNHSSMLKLMKCKQEVKKLVKNPLDINFTS